MKSLKVMISLANKDYQETLCKALTDSGEINFTNNPKDIESCTLSYTDNHDLWDIGICLNIGQLFVETDRPIEDVVKYIRLRLHILSLASGK